MQDLHLEVLRQLEELRETESSKSRIEWFKQQHKGTRLKSLGIKTSKVRKLIRSFTKRFMQLDLEEKFELATMFYDTGVFEQATIGDSLLELGGKNLTPTYYGSLDTVASHFNNWGSVDRICLHVLQPLLLKYREETLTLLKKWNKSSNMWKRRASVVTFVWKIGSSGKYIDEALELCDNLIWDKEDLVKKGVGWALRDNMHGDEKRVLDYVKSLRRKGVSAVITLYAVEELKGKKRKEVLNVKPSQAPHKKRLNEG